MRPLWRLCLAEAIGVFALVFIGAGSIITNAHLGGDVGLVGIALAHGLVLAIVVTATMRISGGHINPAITIGLWVTKVVPARTAVAYIVAQLIGAAVAGALLVSVYPYEAAAAVGLGTPMLGHGVTFGQGVLVEAILTFFLMFAVFGTAVDPRAPAVGGFGIGLVLTFDILAGGSLTGAAMNPARAFGPALASGIWTDHVVYWIGPVLGSILAAAIYSRLLMGQATGDDARADA